jgi:hypothetical protein
MVPTAAVKSNNGFWSADGAALWPEMVCLGNHPVTLHATNSTQLNLNPF